MPGTAVLRLLLDRRLLWRVAGQEQAVFLTFDDGPVPEVTPWVLDTLAAYSAHGTFFCLGQNAQAHPELVERIRAEGHAIGHHSWDHADAWHTPARTYFRSVLRAASHVGGALYRPPYGHLGFHHARMLCKRYTVVMWDVMGGDFLPERSGEACARHVLQRVRPGSIVVLHDNVKSERCLRVALPLILQGLATLGLRSVPISAAVTNRPRR